MFVCSMYVCEDSAARTSVYINTLHLHIYTHAHYVNRYALIIIIRPIFNVIFLVWYVYS